MCGRYTLQASPSVLTSTFNLLSVPTLNPRYNIAPSQTVPVVRLNGAMQLSRFPGSRPRWMPCVSSV
jgi:putative SOS response-associated peptidase YedK